MLFSYRFHDMVKLLRRVHVEHDTFVAGIDRYDPVRLIPDDVPECASGVQVLQGTFREKAGMAPAPVITGDDDFVRQVLVLGNQRFNCLRSHEGMVGEANEYAGRCITQCR